MLDPKRTQVGTINMHPSAEAFEPVQQQPFYEPTPEQASIPDPQPTAPEQPPVDEEQYIREQEDRLRAQHPVHDKPKEPDLYSDADIDASLGFGKLAASKVNHSTIQVDTLPSRFKAYPAGTQIFYRAYTYKELDDYNDSKLSLSESMRFILDGIDAQGMDIGKLTLADFTYIALLRKLSSLGSDTFSVTIKRHGVEFTAIYDFEEIDFEPLKTPSLPIVAKIAGTDLHFMPLDMEHYLRLVDRGLETNERALLAAQVTNVEYKVAKDIIDNASGRDLLILKRIDDYLFHGVKPLVLKYTYKGKERRETIDVTDVNTIVAPFRRSEEFEGSAIQFGVQKDS